MSQPSNEKPRINPGWVKKAAKSLSPAEQESLISRRKEAEAYRAKYAQDPEFRARALVRYKKHRRDRVSKKLHLRKQTFELLIVKIERLREMGWYYADITIALGVCHTTLTKWRKGESMPYMAQLRSYNDKMDSIFRAIELIRNTGVTPTPVMVFRYIDLNVEGSHLLDDYTQERLSKN